MLSNGASSVELEDRETKQLGSLEHLQYIDDVIMWSTKQQNLSRKEGKY